MARRWQWGCGEKVLGCYTGKIMGLRSWISDYWRGRQQPVSLGERGERAAERFLKRLGYKIVARHDSGRLGELDLVAVDDRTVVFVEVKTRRDDDAGSPAEAVDERKQAKLTRLALAFLKRHGLLEYAARFDVVAITWPDDAQKPNIVHYINAFQPVGVGQMFS
jgi:putative endonuclease